MVGIVRRLSLTSLDDGLGSAWVAAGRAVAVAAGGAALTDDGSSIDRLLGAEGNSVDRLSAADESVCTGATAQPVPTAVKTMAAIKRNDGTTPPTKLTTRKC